MEEIMKNRVILILAVLSIIFFIGTIGSCSKARQQRLLRDKEMVARLDLEEKMNKLLQERKQIQQDLEARKNELEEKNKAHEVTINALEEEQMLNKNLSREIEKLTKLKEALEEDLKEALVSGKSGSKR